MINTIKKAIIKLGVFTAAFMAAVLISAVSFNEVKADAAQKTDGTDQGYPESSIDKAAKKLKKRPSSYKTKGKTMKKAPAPESGENTNTGNNEKGEYVEDDLKLLSAIIYCEAGSMTEDARIAVANVIINRANSTTAWGHVNTIREVIYDDKWGVQFTPIKGNPSLIDQAMEIYDNMASYKGTWKYKQMENSISSAKKALDGEKAIPDTYMYFNGSIESSQKKCEEKGRSYMIIDGHIYFE